MPPFTDLEGQSVSVLPRIKKLGDICPITSENEGTVFKTLGTAKNKR